MDEWAPEERLEESMGHLLPEVREMAEVRAAFNEVLQTSELYRRVKSRLSESYSAAQRALSASAAKLKGELATMRQAVSAHCTLLEGESGRLAAQVEEETQRQRQQAQQRRSRLAAGWHPGSVRLACHRSVMAQSGAQHPEHPCGSR